MTLVPLAITSLTHYGQNPDRFKSYFAGCEFRLEEQAEFPLYLPFFVYHQLSQPPSSGITYEATCQALGTNTFKKVEYEGLLAKLTHASNPQQPPSLVVSREHGLDYDPIRDEIRHRNT